MTLGVVLLVHEDFDRAAQIAKLWLSAGCPTVIHVDAKVSKAAFDAFEEELKGQELVRFSTRHKCEWGMWGIVAGTQAAAELLLAEFPDVRHVYLSSGSCLPLRPISELRAYLDDRPKTDFIESAATSDVPWTVGGLDKERFTLRFPFSWKKQRLLFDRYVSLQRRLGIKRKIPPKLVPHMGSQWWCLTRQTLSAILQDPNRDTHDRYFKRVWIPDESYFQTLARLYATQIESRSLTLSKFDYQGKPHVFYDDHLQLLRRSECFVARKIWSGANLIYVTFPNNRGDAESLAGPNPSKIERLFNKAVERRTVGRAGLYMQSRYVDQHWENGITSNQYTVFQGFAELFDDFEGWIKKATEVTVHGHLFAKGRAEFENRQPTFTGGLSSDAKVRDYNPQSFLTNLLWNTRGQRQCFQYGPGDNQANNWLMAKDANAQINVISGAWVIPLFQSNRNFEDLRRQAAKMQSVEAAFLDVLRSPWVKAQVKVWTLAEFVEAPMANLQSVIDPMGIPTGSKIAAAPSMADLTGFGQFLQNLRNQGMHPYLMGDFPVTPGENTQKPTPRRPYLVQ